MWDRIFGPKYEEGIHIHLFLDDIDKDAVKEFRIEADGKIKVIELPEMLRDIADALENIDNLQRREELMQTGPTKYEGIGSAIQFSTDADAIVVVIVGGTQGNGFNVQTKDPNLLKILPHMLRSVADELEESQEDISC